MSFADELRARLPDGMHLPEPFAQTFDWLEEQGWDVSHDRPVDDPFTARSLLIYPLAERMNPAISHVAFTFEAGPPLASPPPEVMARVVSIASIAGDGGTLSLWLDDDGKQWITVFDHGEPFVLTDDPVVALQFLALGYPEPAAIGDATLTPAAVALRDGGDPPLMPDAFRAFVTETFGVTLPDRASDLGIVIPPHTAPNPIRDWLDETMPEPEVLPMPGSTPDNPFIISRDLADALGEEGVQSMRDAFEYVIEEE